MSDSALVSLIVPVFNESETNGDLAAAMGELESNRFGDRFELIIVDDGSTDDSWCRLEQWADDDPRLTLVRLAGNRGPARATRAGMAVAAGEVLVFMPADLQEGIDLVDACLEAWHDHGHTVMMVPKRGRAYERFTDRVLADLFYGVLRLSTGLYGRLSVRAATKLMDRATAEAYLKQGSIFALRTPFVLQQRLPYDVIEYDVRPRRRGRSKWSLRRKVGLMRDMFVDTSTWLLSPWRIAVVGLGVYAALRLAAAATAMSVWWFAAAADVVLAATLLALLSIVGMYVSRIHQELRGGPVYIVRQVRRGQVNRDHRPEAFEAFLPAADSER